MSLDLDSWPSRQLLSLPRTALAVAVLAAGALLTACDGSAGPPRDGPTGYFRALLEVGTGEKGTAGVQIEITGENGKTYARTVPLRLGNPNATMSQIAGRAYADWLLALPAGAYKVKATLVGPDGKPVVGCDVAEAEAKVLAEVTAEVTLVITCAGEPTGGLDTAVIVNRAPSITSLDASTGKFVCRDKPFVAALTAEDQDKDPLAWSFAVTKTPDGVTGDDYCLAHAGGKVSFSATAPGLYELQAQVSDGRSSARLAFPVYIDPCGKALCPGVEVVKSLAARPQATAGMCVCELPRIAVDPNVRPALSQLEPLRKSDPPRPVARYASASGKTLDFVANELVVRSNDPGKVEALRARWNGVVRGELGGAVAPMFSTWRVEVDLARADLGSLPRMWARANGVTGDQVFSSEAGARLFAAALTETLDHGTTVAVNPLLRSTDIPGRSTEEDQTSGEFFPRDAYQWPYMNRASEQDVGTGEAWTFLHSIGRLGTRVRMAIVDGGFILNADFPPMTRVAGAERVPNPSICSGGTPCPWHGTQVALAAAAVPDNRIGVAGPAGPVAALTVLPSPAPDFFAYMEYIAVNVPTAVGTRPHIINISASVDMPAEVCMGVLIGAPVCEALHAVTGGFRAAGTLIFASAGNDGKDVDRTKEFGLCPFCVTEEEVIVLPCELDGVLCVGGLAWDSNQKAGDSAFGSTPDQPGSVDIYGPFAVYNIADPLAADPRNPMPDTRVGTTAGTSFSSPYVAGVAALTWAANPALSAAQVEDILLRATHTTSADSRVHRWVNALGAVMTAAGRDTPPFLRILNRDFTVPQGATIDLSAVVEELQRQPVTVVWRRGGAVVGMGTRVNLGTASWPLGQNIVEAQATDSAGNASAIDTVRVTVNAPMSPPVSVLIAGASTGALCPRGPDVGDAEFNGGPDIQVDVTLSLSPDRTQVIARVDFRATETNPGGNSEVRETFHRTLHTAAPGETILSIASPTTFSHRFTGPGGGFHVEIFECVEGPVATAMFPSGLVRETRIIGDTPGNDISPDGDCRCDTRIEDILFHPIEIVVAR